MLIWSSVYRWTQCAELKRTPGKSITADKTQCREVNFVKIQTSTPCKVRPLCSWKSQTGVALPSLAWTATSAGPDSNGGVWVLKTNSFAAKTNENPDWSNIVILGIVKVSPKRGSGRWDILMPSCKDALPTFYLLPLPFVVVIDLLLFDRKTSCYIFEERQRYGLVFF